MSKRVITIALIGIASLAILIATAQMSQRRRTVDQVSNSNMMLGSPAFASNTAIPLKYTCRGINSSPPLVISNVPHGTKSLVLVLHDPDAPNQDFTHWLLWNIPPATTAVAENMTPLGAVTGTNGTSNVGYFGPCPPAGSGTHRYMFELYALDSTLNLPPSTERAELEKAFDKHKLAHFTLTGLFSAEHS